MKKIWIVVALVVALAALGGVGWMYALIPSAPLRVAQPVFAGENAAALYMEALGVAGDEPLIEWYQQEGNKDAGLILWFVRARSYVSWLGDQDDPEWDEWVEATGVHPREYAAWVKKNREFFEGLSQASKVEGIDDSVFIYEHLDDADLPAKILSQVAQAMFAASLAHAHAGEMDEANARYLDGLRVMRHSFHTKRTLITAAMAIHPLFYVEMITTMPNEHFPGMEAYLDEETRREALEILGSLDEEDPFEYRAALVYDAEYVIEKDDPSLMCARLYRNWMRQAIEAWTQSNAMELLERIDGNRPGCVPRYSSRLARERRNDAEKREMLNRTVEALKASDAE